MAPQCTQKTYLPNMDRSGERVIGWEKNSSNAMLDPDVLISVFDADSLEDQALFLFGYRVLD